MSELTAEKLNVAALMANEEVAKSVETVKKAILEDPETGKLVDAAESIEDVFALVKKFANVTLEQVKVIFNKAVAYYKGAKAALADEVLDNVVGGWSLSAWWNKNKADIVGFTIWGACILGGAIAGAVVGGPGGAWVGGAIGFTIGAAVGSAVGTAVKILTD